MEIKTADGTQHVASSGVGGAGLGLGIAGTTLALLNGGLGNIFGGNRMGNYACNYDPHQEFATKTDLAYSQELARKDAEIALLKSEQNTEVKIADVYARLKGDMLTMERNQSAWNSQQMVNNATMSSAITTNANSIAGLQETCGKITKVVIPKDVICPPVMPRYNTWVAPTTPAPDTVADDNA